MPQASWILFRRNVKFLCDCSGFLHTSNCLHKFQYFPHETRFANAFYVKQYSKILKNCREKCICGKICINSQGDQIQDERAHSMCLSFLFNVLKIFMCNCNKICNEANFIARQKPKSQLINTCATVLIGKWITLKLECIRKLVKCSNYRDI